MPVTPNIIHTAKQMVNAHVVASNTRKYLDPLILPSQSVDQNAPRFDSIYRAS